MENQGTFRALIGKGIRDIVFGTQDGLVSTLGALTGIAQGTGDHGIVILSGFVIVCVESLSMAAGSYLSSKANRQYQEALLDKERKEIEKNIENEEKEIIQMYRARGYKDDEIDIIKKRLLSDKEILLEDMAHKELGIIPMNFENPGLNAGFMGLSYILGGSVPILPYLFLNNLSAGMTVSIITTIMALFTLGAVKGGVFKIGWLKSGLESLAVAGSATALGYVIGTLAKRLL